MEAKKMIKEEIINNRFPLLIFFLLLTFSFPTVMSSSNVEETKKIVLRELEKVVGRPNFAAGDNGEWTVRSVRFIMEKMNWKFNISGDEKNVTLIEEATQKIVTGVSWVVGDPDLNPYRSLTKGMTSFVNLFKYVRDLEKNKVYGGNKNPVYLCFKAFWSTCEVRAPATLEGAVVYRFECGWEFYEKCQLSKWAQDGRWNIPIIN